MTANVIIPHVGGWSVIDREFRQQYEIRCLDALGYSTDWKAENVRFDHDPLWSSRWHSVQNAGDAWRSAWVTYSYPWRQVATFVEEGIFWAAFTLSTPDRPLRRLRSLPPILKATIPSEVR
jgi:hypothetical protein